MNARALAVFLAVLLPVAASAAQFVPPAGWTANPGLAEQPVPRIWLADGAGSTGPQPTIWSEELPFPNPMFVADEFSAAAPSDVSVTATAATLCGSPARVLTVTPRGPGGSSSQIVFERNRDVSYAVGYVRPKSGGQDQGASAFIMNFCPASPDAIDALGSPPGWRLMPAMRIAGAWSDSTAQENIALLSGAPMPELGAVLDTAFALLAPVAAVDVRARAPFTLCGEPAAESAATLTIPSMAGLDIDAIATQNADASYLLVYQGASPQPATLNAMHRFCPR